jgi:hypothetical protein
MGDAATVGSTWRGVSLRGGVVNTRSHDLRLRRSPGFRAAGETSGY